MNTQEAVAATLRITARSRSEWLSGDVRGIQTMEEAELGNQIMNISQIKQIHVRAFYWIFPGFRGEWKRCGSI